MPPPWSRGMIPVSKPGGSGFKTAEEQSCLASIVILSQLATGKGEPPWTQRDRVAIYLRHIKLSDEIHR